MRKFLLLAIVSIISITAYCQDFSNKGKDFWVGYGNHVRMFFTNGVESMQIYLTSDVSTTGNISIASVGFSQNFIVTANQITVVDIPRTAALLDEGLYNHGIHITAVKPIVAYGFIYFAAQSGATVYLPTNTLGKDYYTLNYTQVSNEANSYSYFFVEAVEPGTTTVQITPSQTTKGGWPANVMQTVNLTQGQIYQVLSATDLTGSIIKTVASGSGGCKKVAVFCGSGKINIAASGGNNTADNLYQQMYPASTWGKKYVLIPSINKQAALPSVSINTNFFRVYRPDPTTIVMLNGVVIPSASFTNNYYQFSSSATNLVDADKPILVAQYFTTQAVLGNQNPHDPEMIYLNPVEQTVTDVTVNSMQPASNTNITQHFINVVLRNAGTGITSFKIDGVTPNATITVLPQDNNYAYLRINYNGNTTNPLSLGAHHLTCDSGFNAIAYGFGNVESYGYSAGTNLKDLYQQIGVSTQYGIETTPSVCTGSPFKFKVSLPYCADSIRWNLSNLPGPPLPTNPIIYYTNCIPGLPGGPDSTSTVNGKTLYWYNLPTTYNFGTIGVYPVTITTYTTTVSTCGSVQDIDFDLQISDPPVADFTWVNNGCVTDSVRFSDATVTVKPLYKWWWDFGEPSSGVNNNSLVKNPVHKYANAGTYTVRYTNITTPGCLSDTISKQISITNIPTAKFGMSSPICAGMPVTFSDTSGLVAPGSLMKWHWDFGDGFRITRTTNSDTTHIYSPWNPAVTDTLIVETNTGCKSPAFYRTFKVHPNPVPDFNLPAGVCLPWDSAHFINSSTIADATGGLGYSWNFGDPLSAPNNTSALTNPAHHYNNVGPFSIKLITTSAAGCVDSITKILSNIYPQAIAGFTVNPENCLTTVTSFTSTSNGNGSAIVNYHWDFGDATTGTGMTVAHTYATPGIKIIKHWIVTDKGCNSDTATITITINSLPTVNYTYTAPACETRVISFSDGSTPNTGSLLAWKWNFGDGSPLDPTQSPTHTFANAGTYNVKLIVTTTKGCSDSITKTLVINARPLAGFITPEVCLNDTYAQFLDTSKVALPGNVSGWEWNFGDPLATVPNPNTSILQNPTHSYTAVGPYNIQLIATSNAGCKDTLHQALIVNGSFPIANFTVNNPTTLCANDSVAIVEASTVFPGSITKVEIYWDNINFPAGPPQIDNVPFTGKVYKHLYLPSSQVTKTYQVRYRAYSGGVCVNDKLSTITVNAAPKVQFNIIPDICYDAAPFLITQGSEIGGVPGSFAYSGPGIINSNGLFNPVVAGVGVHIIKYTFTSSAAGCVDTISQTIKVLDTASAKFTFFGPVCEGTAATFKEESTAPAGVILNNTSWDFGDGSPLASHAPGSTFTHAFPGWGSYTVTMFNTSAYGCKSAGKVQQVYISPIPQTSFSFVQSSVCLPNASVSFINNSTIADGTQNTFTYAWDFGDPSSGILNTSSAKIPAPHTYTGTGPYTVSLKVTSGSNCIKTANHLVDFIHPQPKAAFDFNKPEVCIGDMVVFRDLTNGLDGSVLKWNWNFGDGNLGTAQQESHLYTAVKTYNVSLFIVNSRGCNSDTLTQQFTVHPYPVVDAGPDRIVLQGGSITIQSNVTGNDLQYLWSPATYLNNTAIASPTAIDMQDDILYKLTVTARGGCKSFDNMFVKVLKAPRIPNTFTPNGDGMNELWLIEYLDTYPDNRVQVFTRTGQLVFESKGYKTPWDGKINGKALPFDTYYYIIEPGSGRAPITGYVTIIK